MLGPELQRGHTMAVGMYFAANPITPAQYDAAVKGLEAAGAGSPPGRILHVALEVGGQIQVFDIWESPEVFQAVAGTMGPVFAEAGVDPGEPQVSTIYNLIKD
jgi:hypothetical protein